MSCQVTVATSEVSGVQTIECAKDLGGAQVIYHFYSMAGDEKPAGEPFVNIMAMWRAKRDRLNREDQEATAIQARYEEEVLNV